MEKKTNSLWNWFKGSKNEEKQDADRYSASIEMEKQIGEQIYNALQGSVVEEVLRTCTFGVTTCGLARTLG